LGKQFRSGIGGWGLGLPLLTTVGVPGMLLVAAEVA
jgi:hypothetical protein